MKVVVLAGGASPEREVSLSTGEAVAEALRILGHGVEAIDPQEVRSFVESLQGSGGDVVFNALHGGAGEDGRIQAILDLLELPYTGSGYLGSALAMDKLLSKELFTHNGIPTPPWLVAPLTAEDVQSGLGGFPVVVKPSRQGSTVGVTLVKSAAELDNALREAGSFEGPALVERYVAGREMAVGVLAGEALPVVEIRPSHEIYDYECKYTKGMSEYEVPAPLEDGQRRRLRLLALEAHRILRLSGYSRIDFRLDPEGQAWCLEGNSLPGLTETSLLPKGAAAAGIDFPGLCDRILRLGAGEVRGAGTRSGQGG